MDRMGENMIRYFAMQIIDVIDFLNANDVVHCNMTPSHLLVHSNFQIKLIDFSSSRNAMNEMFRITKNVKIDTDYMPNEYFDQSYVDFRNAHKIDIYSFGCILYYLATNEVCYRVNDSNDYVILKEKLASKLSYYSPDFVDIIYSNICLT
jgi:serine/threonine protein kinase